MWTNSLTFKVFKNTIIILFLTFVITYGLVYLLLPEAYSKYVYDMVEETKTKLTYTYETSLDINELYTQITDINENTQMDVSLLDSDDNVVFPQMRLSDELLKIIGNTKPKEPLEAKSTGELFYKNKPYTLKVSMVLSSVEDVKASMLNLIPLMILIILIISVLTALFYTNLIVKPILLLNKKAGKLAKLNFDNEIKIVTDDELGQLSDSLDLMSNSLEKALTELEEDVRNAELKERERRNYMSMMSHELKTPLTIIKGQSECMLNNIGVYKDHNKFLNENIEIVSDLQNLVDQILLSAKLDDVDITINKKEINLKELILEILAKYELLIEEKDVKISLDIVDTFIEVDINLFKLGIKNMIENAIKYCDGDNEVEIYLDGKTFEVTNQYSGAQELNMKNLLKPFERGEISRNTKTGGHGLGLYILKRAFTIHNLNFELFTIDEKVTVKLYLEDENE